MSVRRRALGAAVGVLLLCGGCTSFADTVAAQRESRGPDEPTAPEAPAPGEDGFRCPAERAHPDPERPQVALDFRLEADRSTVTGTETVVFTPDRDTGELVFRLIPNAPEPAVGGNRLVVDAVSGADVAEGRYVAAGAEAPGGLYVVDLEDELAAGESTAVQLDFTLTLGRGTFDRVGTADGVSWWASGAPLLAWEPGVGWARDPFVDVSGETASSPVSDVALRVSAPSDLTVLMTGDQQPPVPDGDGRLLWTSAEPLARDVSVAAGLFTTAEVVTPGGVRVTAGVLPDGEADPARVVEQAAAAIGELEARLGPFPYRTLTVPLLPDFGGGIEYPSSILMAGTSRRVLVHEVAHMWFYGMVGNSQFRDPWLDEAFATYAESVLYPRSESDVTGALALDGDVGASTGDFRDTGTETYFQVVYGKGGAALLAAREAAGAEPFDAAVRCYVDANAWSTATPADVAAVLAGLPPALQVLVDAGALDKADLPR
jgi:hypothetical protein